MRSKMCENVVWQTKDIRWSPAVLAFEPRLKKDKWEVVYKSARLYIKMYFFGESGVEVVWGILNFGFVLFGRSEVWKQRQPVSTL